MRDDRKVGKPVIKDGSAFVLCLICFIFGGGLLVAVFIGKNPWWYSALLASPMIFGVILLLEKSIRFVKGFMFFVRSGFTTLLADDLPDDAQKGFVEFYSPDDVLEFKIPVYELEDNGDIIFRGMVKDWNNRTRLRVSALRGNHTFIVEIGTASKRVSLEVGEKEVAQVQINLSKKGQETTIFGKLTILFNMSLEIQPSKPL
ncbi:hypothetical protein HYY75_07160 [bacterium]|nr:hypothetical protein [bacterium]